MRKFYPPRGYTAAMSSRSADLHDLAPLPCAHLEFVSGLFGLANAFLALPSLQYIFHTDERSVEMYSGTCGVWARRWLILSTLLVIVQAILRVAACAKLAIPTLPRRTPRSTLVMRLRRSSTSAVAFFLQISSLGLYTLLPLGVFFCIMLMPKQTGDVASSSATLQLYDIISLFITCTVFKLSAVYVFYSFTMRRDFRLDLVQWRTGRVASTQWSHGHISCI